MHHRLYAPYTFGGQYVHPLESLVMDTTGNLLSAYASGMSVRLGMIFSAYVAFKFINDHCGYVFPFNPLHLFTGNDTLFHDIHHQSWGLKVCGLRLDFEASSFSRNLRGVTQHPTDDIADQLCRSLHILGQALRDVLGKQGYCNEELRAHACFHHGS